MPAKSRSTLNAEEHQRHVAYHRRVAAEHDAAGQPEAAAKHRAAASAHELAAAAPLNDELSKPAMRASAMADELTQRARHRRSKP